MAGVIDVDLHAPALDVLERRDDLRSSLEDFITAVSGRIDAGLVAALAPGWLQGRIYEAQAEHRIDDDLASFIGWTITWGRPEWETFGQLYSERFALSR